MAKAPGSPDMSGVDPALSTAVGSLWTDLHQRLNRFLTLVATTTSISASLELGEILPRAVQSVPLLLGAETANVLLKDEATGDLAFEIALGVRCEDLPQLPLKALSRVAVDGEAVIIQDAQEDTTYHRAADHLLGFVTRNVLMVPVAAQGHPIGVLEIVNKQPPAQGFTDEDVTIATALANMTAVAIQNARTFSRAIIDQLTGLYNYSFLRERLRLEVERALQSEDPLSLVMFEIADFKAFTAEHGRVAGNQILGRMGTLLREAARKGDIIARHGGEEFSVLLYGATAEQAARFAEKVCAHVAFALDEEGITLSAAVVSLREDGADAEALLNAAEQRLDGLRQAAPHPV
ncbi:MAG: GGDEF domain-containing protein [Candidatus Xenobia bacterium]